MKQAIMEEAIMNQAIVEKDNMEAIAERGVRAAASTELAALADRLARMFPITPLDYLLHQYEDMAGHTAAIDRLIHPCLEPDYRTGCVSKKGTNTVITLVAGRVALCWF
jgi:hypothetical protein